MKGGTTWLAHHFMQGAQAVLAGKQVKVSKHYAQMSEIALGCGWEARERAIYKHAAKDMLGNLAATRI